MGLAPDSFRSFAALSFLLLYIIGNSPFTHPKVSLAWKHFSPKDFKESRLAICDSPLIVLWQTGPIFSHSGPGNLFHWGMRTIDHCWWHLQTIPFPALIFWGGRALPSAVIRPRWQQAGARGCPHCHSLSRDPSTPHVIHLYIHRPSLLHVGPCEYHFGLVWRCLCAATSASSPGPLPGRLKPVAAGCRGTRRCYTETRPSSRSRVSRLPPMMVSPYPRIGLKGGSVVKV